MIKFKARTRSGNWVDSPITPFTFPAGEAHVKVSENFDPEEYTDHLADIRGHNPQDLFHLDSWADFLSREDGQACTHAFIPYLPAARADRGAPLGAHIYAHFINEVRLDNVITIDPHSPVAPGFYNDLTVFPVERIIRNEIQNPVLDKPNASYSGVIAPDKGAEKRALAAARAMGVPVYRAGKTRDEATGRLSGFHMIDPLPGRGKLLVVDDICDGGGTFIGLAEATGLGRERLDLWVTHGIFSKGFTSLADHYGVVHTTDSFYPHDGWKLKDREHDGKAAIDFEVKAHKLDPYLYPEIHS